MAKRADNVYRPEIGRHKSQVHMMITARVSVILLATAAGCAKGERQTQAAPTRADTSHMMADSLQMMMYDTSRMMTADTSRASVLRQAPAPAAAAKRSPRPRAAAQRLPDSLPKKAVSDSLR